MKLREFGFDQWFESHATELGLAECAFARISTVDRGSYRILNGTSEVSADLAGKLAFQIESSVDLPCVGDWVTASCHNNDTAAIIHKVLPRKTFLRRKKPGEKVDHQMIAANIDTAFIVQSCHFDFNLSRLERYLTIAADGHVEPVVILTKTDLITQDELRQQLEAINTVTRGEVIALSNITGCGFDEVQKTLSSGKTYCLLGSSGVGKTTLVNRLAGQEAFATRTVSNTGEGTHTTTRRQLIVLANGAMLIDTPGMRELGVVGASDGLNVEFKQLVELSAQCRFANCSHEHEPGCAVRAAIKKGELPEERYSNYVKLKKESEFYEMSYLEKRKKDKAFGKYIKSVKKQMKG